MKKVRVIWAKFFVIVLSLLSAAVILVSALFEVPMIWLCLIGLLIFLIVIIVSVVKAWTIVPHQYEHIVECLGRYIGEPLKPGLYLLFPWFEIKIITVRSQVFKGQQMMQLYLDEDRKNGYGGGDVEFKDCSSSLSAFFYFRVVDSEKAVYGTDGLLKSIAEKADGILRSFLGTYTLESVIEMKNNFYLEAIATCADFHAEDKPKKEDLMDNWKKSEFYLTMVEWGIEPISMVISDIQLTDSLNKARETIMAAEKVLEALAIEEEQAEKRKKIAVIAAKAQGESLVEIAKGKSEAEKLEGQGHASKLKQIAEAGVSPRQLPQMFINEMKWDAIGKCKSEDKVIIVEGGHGGASYGAELGTGFEASKRRDRNQNKFEAVNTDSKSFKPEVKISKTEKK